MAATVEYQGWTESDDPTPGHMGHDLVFFKAASVNYGHKSGTALEHLVPLADVDGMAYTVKTSTSYAPSYQIDIVNDVTKITYARLVWEPNMQTPSPGDNTGTYTDLEDGLWWGNNVWQDGKKVSPSLFVDGGSQSDPRALTYFQKIFGPDAQVDFFGLKQGSTTESTSTVTSLTFEGNNVPLDSVDATPFSQKDVDAAVSDATAPLTAKVADLEAELKEYKASHPLTNEEARKGYVNTEAAAKAKWSLIDGTELKEYKASHPLTTEEAREGYVNSAADAKSKWALVDEMELKQYMASHPLTTDEARKDYVNSAAAAKSKWALVEVKNLTDYTASHPFTTEKAREGYVNSAAAAKSKWALVEVKNLTDYKASHPFTTDEARRDYVNTANAAKAKWKLVDGSSLVSVQNDVAIAKANVVSISGTKKVGKTVTAKTESIAGSSQKYQWSVAGKSVKGATNASLKLSRSGAKHSLLVKITTSWKDANKVAHSVTATATYTRAAYIAR